MADKSLDMIFTAPHPDDLEITMGGTIARMVKLGHRVGMVHMTDGEPTPRGTPETRRKELHEAAAVLGVHAVEVLGLTNRMLMDGPEARFRLATVLRKYKPRILICMAGRTPSASPDHWQGQLIAEASRFYSQFTKWNDKFEGSEPWRIDHLVYRPSRSHAEIWHWHTTFVVDVGDTMEQKIEAIRCYKSQFDARRMADLEHYVRSSAGVDGSAIGVRYGELFALPRPLGVKDLGSLLGEWPLPPPFATPSAPT